MHWINCDSSRDLISRISGLKSKVFELVEQNDSNSWGMLILDNEKGVIPIGYPDLGVKPEVFIIGSLICVGFANEVVGYSAESGNIIFRYQAPTVFHEFIEVEGTEISFQDETGFVGLTCNGKSLWVELCDDIIGSYSVNGKTIVGKTIGGDRFKFDIVV